MNLYPIIFAFDFSINKPAMCAFIDNKLYFYFWPINIDKVSKETLENCNVKVIDRQLDNIHEKEYDESSLICEHVTRATDLSKMIVSTIIGILDKHHIQDYSNVIIANEGFAFGANGNAILDLSGYKYILMNELMQNGFKIFKTYAPTSLKATAGCKRGTTKEDIVNNLANELDTLHPLFYKVKHENNSLRKKKNYVIGLDDIADSFWCLKTAIRKENIDNIIL